MSKLRDALQEAITQLGEYIDESDYSTLPTRPPEAIKPIWPGHPVHVAICAVQDLLGGGLPVADGCRMQWKYLLRTSRTSDPAADDHAYALVKRLTALMEKSDLTKTQEEILAAIDCTTPRRSAEIATLAGYEDDTTRRHLSALKEKGRIAKTKQGYVRITM